MFSALHLEKVANYAMPIRAIFSEAWHRIKGMKKAFWGGFALLFLTLLGLFVIFQALLLVCDFLQLYHLSMACQFIAGGFVAVFRLLLSISLIFLALQHARNQPVNSTMVFEFRKNWKPLALIGVMLYFFNVLVLSGSDLISASLHLNGKIWVIVSLLESIFLVFFLTYLMLLITMTMLLILDKKMALKAGFKRAFIAINQHWLKNIALLLLASLVFLVGGIITLGVGLIWLLPFISLISAIQYRQIFGESNIEIVETMKK
ncbi:MAG: hypothetical protein V4471_06705 [Pseudomonadota bacterium]